MFLWLSKLFKTPADKNEKTILELFGFMIDDYGFSYTKNDLGNAVDKDGHFVFYGPLDSYHIYNDKLCINILYLVQRQDYNIYITNAYSTNQVYLRNGTEVPSHLAYNLPLFASEVKTSIMNDGTVYGQKIY